MYRNLDIDSLLREADLHAQPGDERRAEPQRPRSQRDSSRQSVGVRGVFSLARVRSRVRRSPRRSR
jgi:hypothetical protein